MGLGRIVSAVLGLSALRALGRWLVAEQRGEPGPLPPESEPPVASAPPMSGALTGPAVPGSRQSAEAWCCALSGAGKMLSDEGFEDQAVMCFVAAGELDAIAQGDMAK